LDYELATSYAITVRASSADGSASTTGFLINLTNVNDNAPTATDDAYVTGEDAVLNVATAGVLTNDLDLDGDSLTAVLDAGPTNGTLDLNADGSFVYTPYADFFGTDSFDYHTTDSGGNSSNTVTVTITVSAVNDAPIASDNSYSIPEGAHFNVDAPGLLGNDVDIDGDVLTVSLVSGPSNGTLILNPDGSFSYQPDALFTGTDSFTYQLTDGVASVIASVTFSVSFPSHGSTALPVPTPVEPVVRDTSPLPVRDPAPLSSVAELGDSGTVDRRFSTGSTSSAQRNKTVEEVVGVRGLTSDITINSTVHESAYWVQKLSDAARRLQRKRDLDAFGLSFDTGMLWDRLDVIRDQLANDLRFQMVTAGAATAITTAFTTGYVIWTLRGGYLLATVLSSLPAWRMMDPLPILDSRKSTKDRQRKDDEEETLASLVDRESSSNEVSN
jgi:hypothetical protein